MGLKLEIINKKKACIQEMEELLNETQGHITERQEIIHKSQQTMKDIFLKHFKRI